MDVRPYPWSQLPRASLRDGIMAGRLASALGAYGRHDVDVPGLGRLVLSAGIPRVLEGARLASRLSDPTSAVAVIRAGGLAADVVVPGRLVRALGQMILGGPDELDAPRAPTPAERGAVLYVVAVVLDAVAPEAQVEPVDSAGPLVAAGRRDALVIDVDVRGTARGTVAAVLTPATALSIRPRSLRELLTQRSGWLEDAAVDAPAVLATAVLDPAEMARIRVRDVVLVDRVGPPDVVDVRVALGRIIARLAPGTSGLTVMSTYERGPVSDPLASPSHLADDASIELSVAAGSVTLPVRQLLELAPGHVLSLNRPLGSAVELRVGRRLVGQGELVDVDGELGVRVLALEQPLVPSS